MKDYFKTLLSIIVAVVILIITVVVISFGVSVCFPHADKNFIYIANIFLFIIVFPFSAKIILKIWDCIDDI
jgi:hypothetical protein